MSPESRDSVLASITRLGHDVVPIEVSVPVPELVDSLEKFHPDLVFNVAEGFPGGGHQSFFTGLFAQLALPYTGSGPHAQMVARDKHLTKLVSREEGVNTPRSKLIRDPDDLRRSEFGLPAIVKPNFGATSQGITQASVVGELPDVVRQAENLLAEYPEGVLVEDYIEGRELTVLYLESADGEYAGALEPTEIVLAAKAPGSAEHSILDYTFKNYRHRPFTAAVPDVEFITPADLPAAIRRAAAADTLAAVRAVGCNDVARVDFRLDRDNVLHMLEVNALPGLDPDLSIHRAAELAGLHPADGVVAAIITSASRRYGLDE
jgi:D-alanine-D-alanine ligase